MQSTKTIASRKKIIDLFISKMICSSNISSCMLDNKDFINLLDYLDPHYKLITRKTFNTHIADKYILISNEFKHEVLTSNKLNLEIDFWKSPNSKNYLLILANIFKFNSIDKKFYIRRFIINLVVLSDKKTINYVAEKITNSLYSYFTKENLDTLNCQIISDAGPNIYASIRKLKTIYNCNNHYCICHFIHRNIACIILDNKVTTKVFTELRSRIRKFIKIFKNNSDMKKKLLDFAAQKIKYYEENKKL